MKVEQTNLEFHDVSADAVVLGLPAGQLSGSSEKLDQLMNGRLQQLREGGEISSDFLSVTKLYAVEGVKAPLVLLIGTGESALADSSSVRAFRLAAVAAKTLAAKKRERVAFFLPNESIHDAVCGSMVGCVGQDIFKSEKKLTPFSEILWDAEDSSSVQRGVVLGHAMNLTRRLVNLPADDIYPETFATECEIIGQQAGFEVEVWDQSKLEQEKCNAHLAVARGSSRPPRLVIMRHLGGDPAGPTLGLVGKGVTFDSGGLSLKPSAGMFDMKCDMAGAGTVVGAMQAISNLKLPVNVIGFAGLAENMVSGDSYKLGDVITSRNGKTIEIHNTDAEGRLVLADTLDVAVEMGVDHLIDLATLTGACMVALGRSVVGQMSNHHAWSQFVAAAAEQCGEAAWSLPMFKEFGEHIKSDVADIKNVGDGRYGGAITAGKFLEEFVRETPWVHFDIAGPSFSEKPSAWIDGGASGVMVRTLVEVAESYPSFTLPQEK